MTVETYTLAPWVAPLLKKLSPRERRMIMRKIAVIVRREQAERIRQQQNPEGTHYAPRKTTSPRQGAIRHNAMFGKLRTARYLHVQSSEKRATVMFRGRTAGIARVHQYGLVDQVKRGRPGKVKYARRGLLGVTGRTRRLIEREVLNALGERERVL